jgi:hypothetical protein
MRPSDLATWTKLETPAKRLLSIHSASSRPYTVLTVPCNSTVSGRPELIHHVP